MGWLDDVYGSSIVTGTNWKNVLPRKIYSTLPRLESNQSWFEVYKIEPEIYVFYEPGQFEEALSYLVVGKEKAALIDTGCGIGNVKLLAEEFTRLPIQVVNTHSHYDHVSQNYLFREIALFDHPRARDVAKNGYTRADMARILRKQMLWKPLPEDFDSVNFHVPPFDVTVWLKDSDIVDLGGRRLEVIHTPGHSPDSICLLDRHSRLFWTGDTFYPGALYLHLPGSDLNLFVASYERMISLSDAYDELLPSHNEPIANKTNLNEVLEFSRAIAAGKAKYSEDSEGGTKIRRYDHPHFPILTK